jgi:hypothetical protein
MGIFGFEYLPYQALYTLYGGFQTPTVKVLVNDNIFTLLVSAAGLDVMTEEITVTLKRDAASSAVFSMTNCYNSTIRKFLTTINDGSKLCILLGYGSVLRPVFQGYVDSVSYEFSDKPKIRVEAYDAVKLMMDSGDTVRTWENNGLYLETIMEIMDDYSDICPFPVTNILPTTKLHGQLSQKSNGYKYVKEVLCRYCDRELIVKGGSAYLVNPYLQFGKLTDLLYGDGLTSFSYSPSYKKVQVEVTGDSLSGAKATSSVKTADTYKASMNEPQKISVTAPLKTSADCKLYAERVAFENIREAQQASGSCIGIPDIVPGVGLGILGVDTRWIGKTLYVDTATHTFNTSGYTTSFEIKGWS